MTLRSFPQPISRGNANASLDLYPSTEQRLVAALGESALGGGVKALANAFAVSDEAIYHRADGQTRTCWHDCIVWLDAVTRAKGQTPAGRRAALAPLRLLVELYMADATAPDLGDAYAALGQLLEISGGIAVATPESLADKKLDADERERLTRLLVTLPTRAAALAAALGINLSAGEVAAP